MRDTEHIKEPDNFIDIRVQYSIALGSSISTTVSILYGLVFAKSDIILERYLVVFECMSCYKEHFYVRCSNWLQNCRLPKGQKSSGVYVRVAVI